MRIKWDQVGNKRYETGVDRGVVYPMADEGYGPGYGWDGLTGVTESPSGAEPTNLYADNIKYITLLSAEDFGGTIAAYNYPPQFEECDGTKTMVPGVKISQQPRKVFAFAYRTKIGNDRLGQNAGYILHIVYGCLASPSEKQRDTINESPTAVEFNWTFTTTPVEVTGASPTAHVQLDSTVLGDEVMKAIEDILYGTDGEATRSGEEGAAGADPRVLLPDEIVELVKKITEKPNEEEPTDPSEDGNEDEA